MQKEFSLYPPTPNARSIKSMARGLVALAAFLILCVASSQGADRYININFGDGSSKTGLAATGGDSNDEWNNIDKVTTVAEYYESTPIVTWGAFTNFVWHDDTAAPIERKRLTNPMVASESMAG